MDKVDLLVRGGEVWTPGGFVEADIAVNDGKVVALGKAPALPDTADIVIDAKGKKVIPGLIDTHTHHRDPGFTHKEDITTATMAAAAGGVTLSIGMPNVNPPTTTAPSILSERIMRRTRKKKKTKDGRTCGAALVASLKSRTISVYFSP